MNKEFPYSLTMVLVSVVICGCTHLGVVPADPLGSMSQIPNASSSPYVAVDASLSELEHIGKGRVHRDRARPKEKRASRLSSKTKL